MALLSVSENQGFQSVRPTNGRNKIQQSFLLQQQEILFRLQFVKYARAYILLKFNTSMPTSACQESLAQFDMLLAFLCTLLFFLVQASQADMHYSLYKWKTVHFKTSLLFTANIHLWRSHLCWKCHLIPKTHYLVVLKKCLMIQSNLCIERILWVPTWDLAIDVQCSLTQH